ncbi:MAG: NlpC/P60 family protein [Streptosporangiales bacterium]|nr:NlpC/P60 family protein [Streptosporangiales bacterium]
MERSRPDRAGSACSVLFEHLPSGPQYLPGGTTPRTPRPGRLRRRIGSVCCAFAAFTVLLPMSAGMADPEPSTKELRSKVRHLHEQLEVQSEQYNGLRVKWQQAKTAAKVAEENARRNDTELSVSRQRLARVAAASYKTGGLDPTVALASTDDPQAFLDQAAVLNHMANQGSAQVNQFRDAKLAAERSRRVADTRAAEAKNLVDEMKAKKDKIERLLIKNEDKLNSRILDQVSRSSGIGKGFRVAGSGKAVAATNLALSKIGSPYVWGAEGPGTFDCSGLSMWAYGQVGINLPHYTGAQWTAGTRVSTPRVGDLVFFYSDLHHMGIVIGNGKMVHAPHTGDVVRIADYTNRPVSGFVRVA